MNLERFLVDKWLPAIKTTIRDSTFAGYEGHVRLHIVPRLGTLRLDDIGPAELNAFYAELLENGKASGRGGLSPGSVRHIHVALHRAFRDAVRWGYLDSNPAERCELAVRQTLIEVSGKVLFSTPKTARGRRVIALDPVTATEIRPLTAGLRNGDSLLFHREGAPLEPSQVSHTFARLVKSSGLPWIRLHDLRHTHATLALEAGVHPKIVSERLGHSTVSFTLDVYSHAIPHLQTEAALKIADLVRGNSL
jgi:integrase